MPKTWKEIKQAYLLTLIKHGDLSRGHLDSLIGEAQRMTSDRGILQADNVEDMRRVVEAHEGDAERYIEYGAEMVDAIKQSHEYLAGVHELGRGYEAACIIMSKQLKTLYERIEEGRQCITRR